MNSTSVYLCNNNVQVAVGAPGKGRARVKKMCNLTLEEGCLINGVVTNDTALAAQLEEFWRAQQLPRKNVELVIDSTQFLSKNVRVPLLSPKKMLDIVKKELAPMETRQDPIVDYMILAQDKAAKTSTILASSVERSFIDTYQALFTRLGVRLACIDTALAALLKLVEALPAFQNMTCILLSFDGDNLLAVLIENGSYKYASRSRLFSEHGTVDFGNEVARVMSGTLQFQASDKSGYTITDVYFAGCSETDFAACSAGCRMLKLSAAYFPDAPTRVKLPEGVSLSNCIYTVGNMIRR